MYCEITEPQKKYAITKPGVHVFYWSQFSADMTFEITAEGATVYLFGLYEANDKDRFTLRTVQRHCAKNSTSHCLVKSVCSDHARFDYEGLIDITADGSGTEATLENRNLVLSDDALVSTKPELQIIPSDVICSHAATVSHINELQKDFMKTRGIDEDAAKKMIVGGFLNDLHTKCAAARTLLQMKTG